MTEVARFLEALRLQHGKYRDMVAVAEEQRRLLEASDFDGLVALVDRKRSLMGDIEALEREISGVRAKWPELRGGLDPAARREIEEAVEQTREVLQSLVRLEDEGRALMERRRDSTAEELKGLLRKKQARGAYGGPAGGDPRFFDDRK